jgi:secondary thiamine-phosphate synthase enzyme
MTTLTIQTAQREEMVDVTDRVAGVVADSGITSGFVFCYVPHTTAAVTINEAADPDVRRDIIDKLCREFPQSDGFHHAEGNSDAHIKTSLIGSSIQVMVEDGRMVLGRWQGIFFCEFDGPRNRRLMIRVG